VLKHAYEEVTLMPVIRQINLQTLCKLSVEYRGACMSTSPGLALGLCCDTTVIWKLRLQNKRMGFNILLLFWG